MALPPPLSPQVRIGAGAPVSVPIMRNVGPSQLPASLKTSLVLSGDQDGLTKPFSAGWTSESHLASVPSDFITANSELRGPSRMNAIKRPSGDQAGSQASERRSP